MCNLFRIKDPIFATALEVAAGGKLYQLVVDTEHTGKASRRLIEDNLKKNLIIFTF